METAKRKMAGMGAIRRYAGGLRMLDGGDLQIPTGPGMDRTGFQERNPGVVQNQIASPSPGSLSAPVAPPPITPAAGVAAPVPAATSPAGVAPAAGAVPRKDAFGNNMAITDMYNRMSADIAKQNAPAASPLAPATVVPSGAVAAPRLPLSQRLNQTIGGTLSAPKSGLQFYGAQDPTAPTLAFKHGGALRTGKGGVVPGSGKGDKIDAKYEPGEFVVSNDMLDMAPGLREHLHELRGKALAAKGITPEQADAKAVKGGAIRAMHGIQTADEETRRLQLPGATLPEAFANSPQRLMGATGVQAEPQAPVTAAAPAGAVLRGSGGATGSWDAPDVQPPSVVASLAAPPANTAAPVNPVAAGALPPSKSGVITRMGNSYSGGPNIAGDISLVDGSGKPIKSGGVISAQNNQAAENLARAGGQTSGFGPAGAIQGGGQVSSIDTSAGYAADLKQLAEIAKDKAAQNTSMQAQSDFAEENAMRARGQGRAARELGALRMNNQTIRREQDLQAINQGAIRKLAEDKFGLESAGLKFDNESKSNLLVAQKALAAAKTPAEKVAAEDNLRALMGKFEKTTPNNFTVVPEYDGSGARIGTTVLDQLGQPIKTNNVPATNGTGVGKPLNDVQAKALLFGSRMQASNEILDRLNQAGRKFSTPGANGMLSPVVNLVNSKEGQQLDQAKRDFLNAVLRRESGAVISDTEFDSGNKQYFPQIGDAPEVIAQKRDNRMLAQRGILAEVPNSESRVSQVREPAAQAKPPTSAAGASQQVASQADYVALPSGTTYIAPDGSTRRKP